MSLYNAPAEMLRKMGIESLKTSKKLINQPKSILYAKYRKKTIFAD